MNAVILLFASLLAATPVEPTARWNGMIADESLQKLAPEEGFFADAQSLEKVWKAWRPKEEVPTVDFKKEMIIVGVVDGPNTVGIDPSLDEKGDLQFSVDGTEVGGPGFGYLLLKVSREGVKRVNGKPVDNSSLKATPAEDLQSIQGKWEVNNIWWPSQKDAVFPSEARLNKAGITLSVEGNRIMHEGKTVATVANDLSLPKQEQEIGFKSHRLLMLTLPDGKGLLCSYRYSKDETGEHFEIVYSHQCSCHRGSGQIVEFKRPLK